MRLHTDERSTSFSANKVSLGKMFTFSPTNRMTYVMKKSLNLIMVVLLTFSSKDVTQIKKNREDLMYLEIMVIETNSWGVTSTIFFL